MNKLSISILALFILSSATGAAASLYNEFEGYSKVRIALNGIEKEFKSYEVPGFVIKGSTVLPLRATAEMLQSLVVWDNNTRVVTLYKPNVHMFVASEISKDYSLKTPFGVVKQGKTIDFVVFPQVDNLKTSISAMRLSIHSPSGKIIYPVNKDSEPLLEVPMTNHKENFWLPFKFENVLFDEAGNYVIKLEMKPVDDSDFREVSLKNISSE